MNRIKLILFTLIFNLFLFTNIGQAVQIEFNMYNYQSTWKCYIASITFYTDDGENTDEFTIERSVIGSSTTISYDVKDCDEIEIEIGGRRMQFDINGNDDKITIDVQLNKSNGKIENISY